MSQENDYVNYFYQKYDGRVAIEAESIPAPTATSIPYRPGVEPHNDPWGEFDRFAVIRVADSGPGIPETDRDRIFFPFFKLAKTSSFRSEM